MSFFVHPQGICESDRIGDGTRIWAFAHVLPGARIGSDVNINDGVFVENDVVIGDRVTIKCGVQVWDGLTLEDDVFVGPNVTFTNDPFPRSKRYPTRFSRTIGIVKAYTTRVPSAGDHRRAGCDGWRRGRGDEGRPGQCGRGR